MGQIIDGKKISQDIKDSLKQKVNDLKDKGIVPGLAVVIVGDNKASRVYVNAKKKACASVNMHSEEHALPADTSQDELLKLIDTLNADPNIHGILVQLPLPKQIDEKTVIEAIIPSKDVDAFHPFNVGRIMIGDYKFLPCTPAGCMHLIKSTGVDLTGKNCVVVGRSNIVGKPMSMLLLHENATVTIAHSRTVDLKKVCLEADVLVVAVGKENIVTADMIKPGAIVIDVGMNHNSQGKLCGDVEYDKALDVAGYITPVPGGVGPMTIAMLLQNTITSAGE